MDEPRVRDPNQVEYGDLPELTRALRALGSSRQTGGTLQSQFFLPLLEARRKAADSRSAVVSMRAFDAAELTTALDRAIDRIIADWPDRRDSARRAIRAELMERVGDYTRALAKLGDRARSAFVAEEPAKLATWRAWTVQLAATFDAADRSWMALRSMVDALPKKVP